MNLENLTKIMENNTGDEFYLHSDSDSEFELNEDINTNINENTNENINANINEDIKKIYKIAAFLFTQKENRTLYKCVKMAKKKLSKKNKEKGYIPKKIKCWFCWGSGCLKCNNDGYHWRMVKNNGIFF
jgi:hypothetical protein